MAQKHHPHSPVSHIPEPIIGSAIGSGIDGGADGDMTFVTVITHVLPDRLCSVTFTLNLCVYPIVLSSACGTGHLKTIFFISIALKWVNIVVGYYVIFHSCFVVL
ncbi:hypothetical protein F2Q69_00020250 [Brassica cretica]|uniref:Uncharacterized protein n=1 Tax=Brassica cretica TaxID=69181 RepID=A0A8S9Q7T9_BRACR|nr:hypothetical protein F2Q69_00020250 [Brassica cretica]